MKQFQTNAIQAQLSTELSKVGPAVIADNLLEHISGGTGKDFYLNCPTGGPCDGPGQGFIKASSQK
jgi:hypothetical protein